jgi:hypothetical protein
MSDLPKIAMRRLQGKSAAAGIHPDSNLISAFVENSLPGDARAQLVQHLAQCADCREIVFLSSPDQAGTLPAASARPNWLAWPVLRWGAAVAAVVVVVAAVSLHRPSGGTSTSPSVVQTTDTPIAKDGTPPALLGEEKYETAPVARNGSVSPVVTNGAVADAGSKPPEQLKKQSSRAASSPMLAQEPGGKASDERRSELDKTQTVEVMAGSVPVESAQAVPGRAKDVAAEPTSNAGGGIGGGFPPNAAVASQAHAAIRLPAAAPRWTLTSDGTLQRSMDFGRTWQTVQVAGQASFRALAASGKDIWVGGSKGALDHSTDAGQNWTQVHPVAAGQMLTDDIIGVEFSDALQGKVTTSSQEVWTTEDGGQSWRKP